MIYDEDERSKVKGSTPILFYFYWIAAKVTLSSEIQEASSLEYPSHSIKYSRFPCGIII